MTDARGSEPIAGPTPADVDAVVDEVRGRGHFTDDARLRRVLENPVAAREYAELRDIAEAIAELPTRYPDVTEPVLARVSVHQANAGRAFSQSRHGRPRRAGSWAARGWTVRRFGLPVGAGVAAALAVAAFAAGWFASESRTADEASVASRPRTGAAGPSGAAGGTPAEGLQAGTAARRPEPAGSAVGLPLGFGAMDLGSFGALDEAVSVPRPGMDILGPRRPNSTGFARGPGLQPAGAFGAFDSFDPAAGLSLLALDGAGVWLLPRESDGPGLTLWRGGTPASQPDGFRFSTPRLEDAFAGHSGDSFTPEIAPSLAPFEKEGGLLGPADPVASYWKALAPDSAELVRALDPRPGNLSPPAE